MTGSGDCAGLPGDSKGDRGWRGQKLKKPSNQLQSHNKNATSGPCRLPRPRTVPGKIRTGLTLLPQSTG